MKTSLVCLLTAMTISTSTMAADNPPADPVRTQAREHFARGLHLFANDDNSSALAEFKQAYALTQNQIVLFNIGLVHASMGNPVDAVTTLKTVLEAPQGLKPEQLARAQRVMTEQEQMIGGLRVEANVPANIDVDGTPAGRTPLTSPLRVASGVHLVGALAEGYVPSRQEVTVAAGTTAETSFKLRPTASRLASLVVGSPLPGADVLVDGVLVGRTPLAAPLALEPGTRIVEARRPGYVAQRQELALIAGAQAQATFNLEPEPKLGPQSYGRVNLSSTETSPMHVTVDGRNLGPYQGAMLLPSGPHHLRLERAGFEPVERVVSVRPGGETPVNASLRPTSETRQAYQSHVGTYRAWAFGALLGGLLMAGGSGGFTYWSNNRLDDSNATLTKVHADWEYGAGGPCDHSQGLSGWQANQCDQRMASAQDDVSKYRDMRTAGIVGTSIGVALVGTGIVLLALGQDPKRYDDEGTEVLATAPIWTLSLGPAGSVLGISGRY